MILTPRVPKLAAGAVAPTFDDLLKTLPSLPPNYKQAADFDWALHPGGATILSGVERAMSITAEHMRASYDTYINHGNSSSATVFSVMDRLRQKDMDELAPDGKIKDFVVGCAFGPGIAIEMCIMKRNLAHVRKVLLDGAITPPESDGSRSEAEESNIGVSGEKTNDASKGTLEEALNGVDLD